MTNLKWLQLIRERRQIEPVTLPPDASARLTELKDIRAVVFDVYGTLFSSGVGDISLATEENRDAALRRVLLENDILINEAASTLRFDEVLHQIIHLHQEKRRAGGVEYPEVEIRAVWSDFLDTLVASKHAEIPESIDVETLVIDYETRVNPTQPMPGLSEMLAELRARGIVFSIISNAQFYTPLLFEAFLGKDIAALGFCPKCNVWSYAELEGKPSEQLYRIAAQRLMAHHEISPEQCLYLGNDMRNDIWPAQALGFRTALFAGDKLSLRRREEEAAGKDQHPDLEITELSQIQTLIRAR
ncbi:MAG: HAD family hydrolase [Opitutales bacterium]